MVTDSLGQIIELNKPARRIVSLAPHTTEMLFAAGAGEWVVGAVKYSDYPQQAKKIPRVGGYKSFDYEAIIALKPDLVIAWQSGNSRAGIDQLKKLGYPVFVTEPRTFSDIPELIESIAVLTDTVKQAELVIRRFNEQLKQLRERYQGVEKLKVFYQVWRQPLMTVNSDHLINKVINLCGGINIFQALGSLAGSVGIESVLQRDPDLIIVNGQGERFKQWGSDWQQWKQLQAVRNHAIFDVNPDTMSRHSPRILQGAEEVCSILESVRSKKNRSSLK